MFTGLGLWGLGLRGLGGDWVKSMGTEMEAGGAARERRERAREPETYMYIAICIGDVVIGFRSGKCNRQPNRT